MKEYTKNIVLIKKIKELSDSKFWNVKEFFKSNYITSKDVQAWLCLAEIVKK